MGKGTYASFKTNADRERQGIVLDLGTAGKFKLARAGGANDAFQRRLMAITKPHRRAIQTQNIDPKVADELLARAFAETVLLGWEDVTGEDGKFLEFNKDNAVKLLTELPDLFREIRETSEDNTLFLQDLTEADSKNS